MTLARNTATPEKHVFLWLVAAGPAIWAAHFLLSYITAAVWCARFAASTDSLAGAQLPIAVYTVAALAGIALIAFGGYRRHGRGFSTDEHEMDTPDDRHRFLGFATLLLAGLSAVATIYVAISMVLIRTCT